MKKNQVRGIWCSSSETQGQIVRVRDTDKTGKTGASRKLVQAKV